LIDITSWKYKERIAWSRSDTSTIADSLAAIGLYVLDTGI